MGRLPGRLRGLGVIEVGEPIFYDDGSVEQRYSDGTGIIVGPDGNITGFINADGTTSAPDTALNDGSFDWKALISALPGTITAAQTAINTQKLLELNIQRAAAGLPPITAASVAPTINVGLDAQIKNMLMIGGIAVIALMALKK